jgi:general secretion pathway protein C
VVNETRPRLSLAMVRKPAGTAVVFLGGRVDDFTVVAIESARAALQTSDGARCALSAVSQASPSVAPAPVPAATVAETPDKPPPGKPVFSRAELASGVRLLGTGSYLLSRSLLLKALSNPGGAAGGAWFRLFEREGRRVGMEVRAVRDGSALQAMGMQTGDVVRSVNGIALDTPDGLMAALRAARESDTVALAIQRDGLASDLRYTID